VASKSTKKQGTKRKLETPRFSDPYAEEFDKKRFEQSLKRFAGQYKYKDIDLPGFRLVLSYSICLYNIYCPDFQTL
jgi:hypothetical protein